MRPIFAFAPVAAAVALFSSFDALQKKSNMPVQAVSADTLYLGIDNRFSFDPAVITVKQLSSTDQSGIEQKDGMIIIRPGGSGMAEITMETTAGSCSRRFVKAALPCNAEAAQALANRTRQLFK